ncbi:MAG: acetate kinase [Clostridiales bacterium]|nr:acetate kinase [Clostridiales bacterium]
MNVLVINAGSSSLKYQLFNMDTKEVLAKGLCERIGIDGRLTHTNPNKDEKFSDNIPMKDHADAIRAVINILIDKEWGVIESMSEIDAVGHRVVHGGEFFADSVLINDEVIKAIEACIPLAPLHNTPNLIGIDACKDVMGENIPQVAVFDTAFHQSMKQANYMYALPYEYYEKYKIRRYGFHGTSHKYVSKQASEMLGIPIENLRIVTCHLGNGSSITAIKGGKSVDTSMGFTPLDGLPMGTRAGNLDPAIISFLCEHENKSAEEVIDILNKKSGMLGISGVSSDFRDLDTAINEGNPRAKLAKDMFILSVKKIIGSYIAEMGGVDAIVFTAGVGENDRSVRWDVCEHMEYLGIKLDPEKNKYRGRQMDISVDYARVRVLVIPTNEELVIAEDTKRLVEEANAEK